MKITKALTRLTGPETAPVFVLLHGWGSNEYDLPDLLNYCGAGSADYASLQAPIAYGMGYTWHPFAYFRQIRHRHRNPERGS